MDAPGGRTGESNGGGNDESAFLSRRALLGAGGAVLTAGLAGCIYHGPFERTELAVTVREPFDAEPPVRVPVTVEAFVQNVDSKDVALRGADLVLCDGSRDPLTRHHLGDFAWREADPERRRSETHDTGWFATATAYSADWRVEHTLEVDEVPAWLTVRVDDVRFGDEDAARGAGTGLAPVGKASASQPPPEFTAVIRRFDGESTASSVAPGDYRRYRVDSGVDASDVTAPIFPPGAATDGPSSEPVDRRQPRTGDGRNDSAAADEDGMAGDGDLEEASRGAEARIRDEPDRGENG